MDKVFIVAQHRTGSTLLKNMLNAHSSVTMAFDEMNLYEPMRNNTLDKFLSSNAATPEKLVEAIYSQEIYGTFWNEFETSGIDKEQFLNALQQCGKLTEKNVLSSVLDLLKEVDNKPISGVKYPVHVSKTSRLLEWFPESKVIFLTRNPLAIIASKVNDPATKKRKSQSPFHRFAIHYFTLLYFCLEFRASVKIYLSNKEKLLKVTYEELVFEQEKTILGICDYISLDFEKGMLQVGGKPSSHTPENSKTLNTQSVAAYKSKLNKFDQWLVKGLTHSLYKKVI